MSHSDLKQRGAVLVLVALVLPVLLGLAGLVIDVGMMFVTKSEMQSAADSCALAAAIELDGASDALTRAASAGITAGNVNKVAYQASSAGFASADITFSDALNGSYSSTFSPVSNAQYARCTGQIQGLTAYLIRMVGGPNTVAVAARATATRSPGQNVCVLPLGLIPKSGGTTANNYGFQVGEWVNMLYGTTPSPGEMGWFNMDNSNNSAAETVREIMYGYCGANIGKSVGTPGVKATVDEAWNARFGIYKNNAPTPSTYGYEPDYTGYAYTSINWAPRAAGAMPNAYSGSVPSGSDSTADNFQNKRLAFASYDNTGTSVNHGDSIYYTGNNGLKGGFKSLATPGTSGQHHDYGMNKRVVAVSVLSQVSGGFKIQDYACMLMLQPLTCNNASSTCDPVQLEFLGLAKNAASPCGTVGMAGGQSGPLIPVLVE